MYQSLYEAYRGELFGIEFFKAFAEQSKNPAECEKWECLIDLERHTASLLQTWLQSHGQPCTWSDPEMEDKGRATAAPWLALGWNKLMATLEPWIENYALKYRQEVTHAPAELYWVSDMTAAHEEAILAFVKAERAGDDDSLKAVREFMANYPVVS